MHEGDSYEFPIFHDVFPRLDLKQLAPQIVAEIKTAAGIRKLQATLPLLGNRSRPVFGQFIRKIVMADLCFHGGLATKPQAGVMSVKFHVFCEQAMI